MRIVHIEDFFHPDAGYQINLLAKYMVAQGHDVIIVTSCMEKMPDNLTVFFGKEDIEARDRNYFESTGVKIIRVPIWKFISGRAIYKKKIFNVVKDMKPDVLYVHGNDTLIGIQYILRYKKLKCKLVLDSHMLEMASVNKFNKVFHWSYRQFITPKIVSNNILIIRTQNDNYVQRCLGIPLERCPWISIGSDTMLFRQILDKKNLLREKYIVPKDDFVVIYAGKIDESKGGELLAKAFEEKFVDADKNVTLIIIGNMESEYGQTVESILDKSKNNIVKFPTQKYIDLAQFYQMADIAVFPRQCSLSFYDVQACGLPTVLEENNINIDRVSYKNGLVFKENDIQAFRNTIKQFLDMSTEEFKVYQKKSVELVEKNYDYADVTQRYLEVIIASEGSN